jgi:hypothetical protein
MPVRVMWRTRVNDVSCSSAPPAVEFPCRENPRNSHQGSSHHDSSVRESIEHHRSDADRRTCKREESGVTSTIDHRPLTLNISCTHIGKVISIRCCSKCRAGRCRIGGGSHQTKFDESNSSSSGHLDKIGTACTALPSDSAHGDLLEVGRQKTGRGRTHILTRGGHACVKSPRIAFVRESCVTRSCQQDFTAKKGHYATNARPLGHAS